MRYRFDQFDLDTEQFVLRAHGTEIHLEPLVFDLLAFFVEHVGQVLTRDAIVERVWKGRFVSDATVASAVKSVRKALGDSGEAQTYVRTIRGRGFQFTAGIESLPGRLEVAEVRSEMAPQPSPERAVPLLSTPPRIAVLPLFPLSLDPELRLMGDAVAQEVILELSRLHSLVVIARGSSFKYRGQEIDLGEAGAVLGASYLVTGTISRQGRDCVIAVELCRADGATVIWAERFVTPAAEIMHMRSVVAGEIVAAVEPRTQMAEALAAAGVPTERLDAWAAYHRGLWHMFRFSRRDNEEAAALFHHAIRLDPGFARAHAGLSFTHFQNAFQRLTPDEPGEMQRARAAAETSLALAPLDPFVNLTMGRAEWLDGRPEAAVPWMERSIQLSPNYAFAIYNSALLGTLLGDGDVNETKISRAISLSPIDPMRYAMLATRALTYAVRGDFVTAAMWADRAVRSPHAHVQIYAIAAITHELSGNRAKCDTYVRTIRLNHPDYSDTDFLKLFPFGDLTLRRLCAEALRRLGF